MALIRKTLRSDAVFEGLGLHSGAAVRVVVHPGENGIWFRYGDESVQALAENVVSTRQCTQLGPIFTIEHLMSALAGWEITDAVIEVSAPEIPAMDGSARAFALGLADAGFAPLPEWDSPRLFKRAYLAEGDIKIAVSSGHGHWSYRFDAGDRWPHVQDAEFSFHDGSYLEEIAPARTFAFEEQVEPLRAAGFAKGLDMDSALILGPDGPVNPMRVLEEPARHKLLDLIGDLALTGIPLRGLNVTAERSGHRTNVEMALKVRQILGLTPV
jgi:UDP-3-O-acyl-N-acetylglucosamine deacetylase